MPDVVVFEPHLVSAMLCLEAQCFAATERYAAGVSLVYSRPVRLLLYNPINSVGCNVTRLLDYAAASPCTHIVGLRVSCHSDIFLCESYFFFCRRDLHERPQLSPGTAYSY